mgnify:FL=1
MILADYQAQKEVEREYDWISFQRISYVSAIVSVFY